MITGVIRAAKRPPGWVAPGPPPLTPAGDPDVWPSSGEDLCHLTGDWRILQLVDGHRWSHDDLITAWVAADECRNEPPRRICDLGCGIGAVLLMMAWRFPAAQVVGIEAQEVSVGLARRSIAWNGAAGRCRVHHGDLRDQAPMPEAFDLITGTPPYLPVGTAHESTRRQWGPCHFEHRGGVGDYVQTAARLLARNGRFVVCAALRDADRVSQATADAGLAIKRRLDVVPREGKGGLFSLYVLRFPEDATPMRTDTPLSIRDGGGHRTLAYLRVRSEMGMPP